jgi:single-strand DNA-binding protein
MRYMNQLTLAGRIARDPELKHGASGAAYCRFTITTVDAKQVTSWHNVTVFGHVAERIATEGAAGSWVNVEGRLTYNTWEKDGVKRTTAQVIAQEAHFDGQAGGGAADSADGAGHLPF